MHSNIYKNNCCNAIPRNSCPLYLFGWITLTFIMFQYQNNGFWLKKSYANEINIFMKKNRLFLLLTVCFCWKKYFGMFFLDTIVRCFNFALEKVNGNTHQMLFTNNNLFTVPCSAREITTKKKFIVLKCKRCDSVSSVETPFRCSCPSGMRFIYLFWPSN